VIGHYGATQEGDGVAVLEAALGELARRGCTFAVGPMDGNTWRRYRLVTDRGTEPPYFMETTNPDDWPAHYAAAGFTPLEALQTATINPARFLAKTLDFGSVEKGRVADLVILRANPLEDIANTRTIAGVVADGRYWSQAEIEALRAQIKRGAAAR
jgi:adenine deaminase